MEPVKEKPWEKMEIHRARVILGVLRAMAADASC